MNEVTKIISEVKKGLPNASDQLLPLVYDELRKLAVCKISSESPGITLQATALVHEAYLRLVGSTNDELWDDRGHFFAAAAEAMRRILVEAARRRHRTKRGGGAVREDLHESQLELPGISEELLAVHDVLDRLQEVSEEAARLVKLRYFAGFTINESAAMMKISPRKANQIWAYARAWLIDELSEKS